MDDLTKIYVERLLNGAEYVEINNPIDKDAIIEALHKVDGHYGVVISGNNPWYISIMKIKE